MSVRRLGTMKVETRRLADAAVQVDTTIVVPEDAMPSAGGAQQMAAKQAAELDKVDVSRMTDLINAALGATSLPFSLRVTSIEKAVPAYLVAAPDETFVCQAAGCSLSASTQGESWRYEDPTGPISLSECKRRCASTSDCTGMEWPKDGMFCIFWLNNACEVSNSPPGLSGWSEGQTCSKRPELIETEESEKETPDRAASAVCSWLVVLISFIQVVALHAS